MASHRVELVNARVAVITNDIRPANNELWLAAREHVEQLLLIGPARRDHTPQDCEVELRAFHPRPGLIWRHLQGLRRVLGGFNPDLVHVNGELWGLTVQEVLAVPSAVVAHGAENLWFHGGVLERRARSALISRAISRLAGYASWNEAGAQHIRALAPAPFPVTVLPAAVPPASFRNSTWGISPASGNGEFRILLVGRLVPEKGFETVIRAVSLMHVARRIQIVVCGEGTHAGALEDMARELGVQVRFAGRLSISELADLMGDSHCLVQPSVTTDDWAEQFGRSVAEAMTVGLPCLVSDSGELPLLVGFDSEVVFAEGNATDLANRLDTLAGSDELLSRISRRQRTAALRYHPELAAVPMSQLWQQALDYERSK